MGVHGLYSLIRAKIPDATRTYRSRWNASKLKGKTVALDATLLTNRFHFAGHGDVDMDPKRVVIGWHALITRMRSAGVVPIAIWDEPGQREWKTEENKKRATARSLHLSRAIHEESRDKRLASLQAWVEEVRALDEAGLLDLGRELAEAEGKPESTLTPLVRQLLSLISDTELSSRPYTANRKQSNDMVTTLREFESSSEDADRSPETAEHPQIDEDVVAIAPSPEDGAEGWTESPRQTALTGAEMMLLMDLKRMALEVMERAVAAGKVEPPLGVERAERAPLEEEKEEKAPREEVAEMDAPPEEPKTWESIESTLKELQAQSKSIAKTHDRGMNLVSRQDHLDSQDLLRTMGVPVVLTPAPFEAEGVASHMALTGLADYVATEDSDVLVYGARMLRNATVGTKPLEVINGTYVREVLGLDEKAFLDTCILMGTDATKRIFNVGPVKALQLLKKHGSIERVLIEEPEIAERAGEGFLDRVVRAREMFMTVPPLPEPAELKSKIPKDEVVLDYLRDVHGVEVRREEREVAGLDHTLAERALGEMNGRSESGEGEGMWNERGPGVAHKWKHEVLDEMEAPEMDVLLAEEVFQSRRKKQG